MHDHDSVVWHCRTRLVKYASNLHRRQNMPFEIIEDFGNMLLYGGSSALRDRLTNASPTVGPFDNAHAQIGVGDSTTGAAATQTGLQAGSNTAYVGMDASYPLHTDGTGAGANAQVVFQATFGSGVANFDWREWIVRETGGNRALNRKQKNNGSKVAGMVWVFQVTIALA